MPIPNGCPRPLRTLITIAALLLGVTLPLRAASEHIIVISEIMYHPEGGGQDLEYIELHNTTPAPIDLSGWFFSRGVTYVFPEKTFLRGRSYVVVCADVDRIKETYSISNVLGNWAGCNLGTNGCALDNGGETIELSEPSGAVHARVRYNDRSPWPSAADGTGFSLEIVNADDKQADPDNWTWSGARGGSPGKPNGAAAALAERPPVRINEALLLTAGDRWVELYNDGDEEIDLSGHWLSTSRDDLQQVRIADGTKLPARGWLAFAEGDSGLDLTPLASGPDAPLRTFVVLTAPDGEEIVDANVFRPEADEASEARIPDGAHDFSDHAVPTRAARNRVDVVRDIVINEVMYHPWNNDPSAEYIELYNRGDAPVVMTGWRLTNGIHYDFPDDYTIPSGGYVVVARDPAHIREVYGLAPEVVLGPDPADLAALDAFGGLNDDGERITLRDAFGNVADTIHYQDGGDWPLWPDAGGSSMELIDPAQDNDVAAAWDSSDDSAEAQTEHFEYESQFLGGEPELHFFLATRGITLIDNVRMFQRQVNLEVLHGFIEVGDEWKYFKGTQEPSEPREAWRQLAFDDSAWLSGTTGIGYGEKDESTLLDDMRGNYITAFFRKKFVVNDIASLQNLVFEIEYDDGYIAYLNGAPFATGNMREGMEAFDARARSSREKVKAQVVIENFSDLLVDGENVLAVQVHNATISSTDFRFIPRLVEGRFVNEDGPNLVTNGDFEEPIGTGRSQPGFWYIEGTHVHSGQSDIDPIAGTASMKVVATGKGDNKVNRLETTLPNLQQRVSHFISFDARWVVGSPTIISNGYNGYDLARSHRLTLPRTLGTPGAINSVTALRIAATGDADLGPVISELTQAPALPRAGEDTHVSVKASDSDGIASVKLYWSRNTPLAPGSAQLREIEMAGPDADGLYHADVPGQAARQRVVFYLLAEDTAGQIGRYPPSQLDRTGPLVLDPASPALIDDSYIVYRHDNPVGSRFLSYRFWMHQLNETYLSRRRLHSNDLVEGSFVYENKDIYHRARLRFSGSPFARGSFGSFRISLAKDRPLFGDIKKFNMESHQGAGGVDGRERISHYLIRHNQGGIRVPYSYQWLAQLQVNDRVNQPREHVMAPNRQFLQKWFPGDQDGAFFEMDDRHWFNDGGGRAGSQDGLLQYPPYRRTGMAADDKELYRYYFMPRQNEGLDDYRELIEFARLCTSRETPDAQFDDLVWDRVNVEEMLRVWSIRMNTDDWDTWGTDRGKNCYLYRPVEDGRWNLLAWDMELTYAGVSKFDPGPISGTYNIEFPAVRRFINRPRIKRLYYGIMKEMIDHQFNSAFLAPYMALLRSAGVQRTDIGNPNGFIDQRRNLLERRLKGAVYPDMKLEVTTNGGEPLAVEAPVVTIEGRAPVDVMSIDVKVNNEDPPVPVEVVFSNDDYFAWSADVPLADGQNTILFLGRNTAGGNVDADSIEVTVSLTPPAVESIDPGAARAGESVAIHGAGFYPGIPVFFGEEEAEIVDYSGVPGDLLATVPSAAVPGTVNLVVGNPAGSHSEAVSFDVIADEVEFVRGDVDLSGSISVTDAVQGLHYLFAGLSIPCLDAADSDDDGRVTLTDPVVVLNFLFRKGVAPPPPFPARGADPTADDLGCEQGS